VVFQRDAADILQRLLDAERRAQQMARGEAGHLRIGFVASAAISLVPSVVLAFRKRYPDVTLDLMNLRNVDQIFRLVEGSIDAGYLRLPISHPKLEILPIHKEPFVLVVPPGHALAAKPELNLRDTRNEDFLAYGRRWAPGFFDLWISIFEQSGFTPRIVQETGEMGTLLALVSAGVGLAVVPSGIAAKSGESIVIRKLPPTSPFSEIGFGFRSGDDSPLLARLLTLSRGMGRKASWKA